MKGMKGNEGHEEEKLHDLHSLHFLHVRFLVLGECLGVRTRPAAFVLFALNALDLGTSPDAGTRRNRNPIHDLEPLDEQHLLRQIRDDAGMIREKMDAISGLEPAIS